MGWNNFWSGISYLCKALCTCFFTNRFYFVYLHFLSKKIADWLFCIRGSFFDYVGRAEIHQLLFCLFRKFDTSKSRSEINWPLISKWRENRTRIRWRHFFHVSKLAVENSLSQILVFILCTILMSSSIHILNLQIAWWKIWWYTYFLKNITFLPKRLCFEPMHYIIFHDLLIIFLACYDNGFGLYDRD